MGGYCKETDTGWNEFRIHNVSPGRKPTLIVKGLLRGGQGHRLWGQKGLA